MPDASGFPPQPSLLEAALAYAAEGIGVFPCEANGKRPAVKDWPNVATVEPNQITAWWGTNPNFNIGLVLDAAGLCAVDLDRKGNVDGLATWAMEYEWQAPSTRTVETPSGGKHLYYRGSVPSTVGKLGPGIDTRGAVGFVLAPPSVIDGTLYKVLDNREPAALPDCITEALTAVARPKVEAPDGVELDSPENIDRARTRLRELVKRGDVATENEGGNDRTYRLAAEMLNLGLSTETATDLMAEEWNGHCEPPWDTDELEVIVENASRYAQNEPGAYGISSKTTELWNQYAAEHAEEQGGHDQAGAKCRRKVRLHRATGIKPMAIDWMWPGYFARGKFHVLAGGKGAGKSSLIYDLFARISCGGKWPDGTQAPIGDVLIWSGEDALNDTILPRFLMAGGDQNRLLYISDVGDGERAFDPADDMRDLLDAIGDYPDLLAVLIDPIVLASRADSNKNAETRRGLQPFVDLIEKRHLVGVGISHFTKNTQGKDPIERITGTLAYGAAARVALAAAKGEDEDGTRLFVRIGANIGRSDGGFEYMLRQEPLPGYGISTQRVIWGRQRHGSGRELLESLSPEKASQQMNAVRFLEDQLKPAGNAGVPVKALKDAAEAHSLSWATVRRAKDEQLAGRIKPKKTSGTKHGEWWWVWVDADPNIDLSGNPT